MIRKIYDTQNQNKNRTVSRIILSSIDAFVNQRFERSFYTLRLVKCRNFQLMCFGLAGILAEIFTFTSYLLHINVF